MLANVVPSLPASVPNWTWPIFWLVCPIVALASLLGLVVLVTLFRAPRSEATKVLAIFASAFVRLADRLPAADRSDSQGLDAARQVGDHQESDIREVDVP